MELELEVEVGVELGLALALAAADREEHSSMGASHLGGGASIEAIDLSFSLSFSLCCFCVDVSEWNNGIWKNEKKRDNLSLR